MPFSGVSHWQIPCLKVAYQHIQHRVCGALCHSLNSD